MNKENAEKQKRMLKKVTRAGLLLLALLCLIVILLALRFRTAQISVKVGDVFPSDIKAPFTGTDSFLTDQARQKARETAPVVYETAPALVSERKAAIENWFAGFEGWLSDMASLWEQDTEILENKYRFRGLNATWHDIISEEDMAKALERRGISGEVSVTVAYLILDKYMPANRAHLIGEPVNAADFKSAFMDTVYPMLEEGINEKGLSRSQTTAKTSIKKKTLLSALKTEVAGKLVDRFLLPTITVDEKATEENRRLAASTVADVKITRGQVLFNKGATVTAEDITHLTSLGLLQGTGEETAFSFPALLLYSTFSVFTLGLWLILFEKRRIMRTGSMLKLTVTYALSALFAFGFTYLEADGAPVLFALLCASEEEKKEHSAGVLLFSVLLMPVLLDTDEPFGAQAFITGASLLIGGLTACCMRHAPKGNKPGLLITGMVGGTVIGLIRLCPLLWEGASRPWLVMGFGFPFIGGLVAAILAVLARPLLRKLDEN